MWHVCSELQSTGRCQEEGGLPPTDPLCICAFICEADSGPMKELSPTTMKWSHPSHRDFKGIRWGGVSCLGSQIFPKQLNVMSAVIISLLLKAETFLENCHKSLNALILSPAKSILLPGMVVHTCNSSTWEVEAGGSWIPGQPGLHSKFKDNLSCIVRPCLKNEQRRSSLLML
jgi:hypothetical protein